MDFKFRANTRVILFLLVVQIVSLAIAELALDQNVEIVVNDNGVATSLYFFLLIMATTLILLLIIKLKLSKYLYKFIEYFGLFFIVFFISSAIFDDHVIGLSISAVVMLVKALVKKEYITFLTSLIIIIGISSIIGASFYPITLVFLLILLSVYDFVAVKKTKHMLLMAEDVLRENGPQLLSFTGEDEEIIIGLADIIFPTALFVSVYLKENMLTAIFTSAATIIGLILLFKWHSEDGMPAIPFVSLGIVGYVIGVLIT